MSTCRVTMRTIACRPERLAVRAAAQQSATRLTDTVTGAAHDYRAKRHVLCAEVLAPRGAWSWAQGRASLWNQVETVEAARCRPARSAVALRLEMPGSLSVAMQCELLVAFAYEQFLAHGHVVDLALHLGARASAPTHAHLLVTSRRMLRGRTDERLRDDAATFLLWQQRWDGACARAERTALLAAELLKRPAQRTHRSALALNNAIHAPAHERALPSSVT